MNPPEVTCRLCKMESSRAQARIEGWRRDASGWECPNHRPIDWGYAGDLCHEAGELLEKAMEAFYCKDPSALAELGEVRAILQDLAEATAPLLDGDAPGDGAAASRMS